MIETKRFVQQLRELIAAPSVSCTTPDLDMSNRVVVDILASWLKDFGFDCIVAPVEDNPGKYNLIATLGKGSGGLVLSGHTDTVPCNPDKWQQDPFVLTEKSDRFYGLGATDMKGFFPVILAAIDSFKDQLNSIQQPLIVLATADEESSMSGARALTRSAFSGSRYAIIGEPTGMKPIRMHKGIGMAAIRIQGQAGHSSDPSLGKNALETMHAVIGELLTFREELQKKYQHNGFTIQAPTMNLGCIHGGDNPNRICGGCELQFDLRTLPGMSIDSIYNMISERVLPVGERFATPVLLEKLFPGVEAYEEPTSSELIQLCEKLTGYTSGSVAFATEAPFLQNLGMQTIVMGPGSIDQAHQPNEFLDHSQIIPAVNTIKGLIQKLCF